MLILQRKVTLLMRELSTKFYKTYMELDEYRNVRSELEKLVDNKRVGVALGKLLEVATSTGCAQVSSCVQPILDYYNFFTGCVIDEVDDPQRERVFNDLVLDTYYYIDMWSDAMLSRLTQWQRFKRNFTADDLTREASKLLVSSPSSKERNDASNKIFDIIWTTFPSRTFADAVSALLNDPTLTDDEISHLVGAIAISLQMHFSPEYCTMLLNIIQFSDRVHAAGRAAVALMLSILKHGNRWHYASSLISQYQEYIDNEANRRFFFCVLLLIARSKAVPQMTNSLDGLTPKIMEWQNRTNAENKNMFIPDVNWDDIFRNDPSIKRGMDKLTRWQIEGADVFWSSSRFMRSSSFFKSLSHWLLPYNSDNKSLEQHLSEYDSAMTDKVKKAFGSLAILCDSDKYSLVLNFSKLNLPLDGLDIIQDVFDVYKAERGDVELPELDSTVISSNKLKSANAFVQDLYRVFNTYVKRAEFDCNPFEDGAAYNFDQPLIKNIISQNADVEQLAELYVDYELYADAEHLYEKLSSAKPSDVDLLRKLAFCQLKTEHNDSALQSLLKADLIGEPTFWTKRKIAECYAVQANFRESRDVQIKHANYLQAALDLQPDNVNVQTDLAQAYFDLGEFDDALKLLFKIHYNNPDNEEIIFIIAWALFSKGNDEQVEAYLDKVENKDIPQYRFLELFLKLAQRRYKAGYELFMQLPTSERADAVRLLISYHEKFAKRGFTDSEFDILTDVLSSHIEK